VAEGAVVATMMQPRRVRGADYATRRGLPHDSVVFVGGVPFFDLSFSRGAASAAQPTWYTLNHAEGGAANVQMAMVRGRLRWLARRYVEAGEELRYNYGEAPAGWR